MMHRSAIIPTDLDIPYSWAAHIGEAAVHAQPAHLNL